MRGVVVTLIAASALSLCVVQPTYALPAAAPGVSTQSDAKSDIQDTRTYCYNRYSGQFLHWGSCGYSGVHYHPRTYCRNTYTGQFLHWGSCW